MKDLTESQAALLKKAVDLITPVVRKIESSLPTTKGHYDKYMAVLAEAPTPQDKRKLAITLILAGANKDGVLAALKLS